jgi:glycosyltransferase involved in cell wall biosynthesis
VIRPLVSIIIPTYNRGHLIGETLESVLCQTYDNWECLVIDDGSTDNTDALVQGYLNKDNRIKFYHRPELHLPGGGGARNYGFLQSNGDYLIFLDSDDIIKEDCLEKRVQSLSSFNDTQILVFSAGLLQNEKRINKVHNRDFNSKATYLHNFLMGVAAWEQKGF